MKPIPEYKAPAVRGMILPFARDPLAFFEHMAGRYDEIFGFKIANKPFYMLLTPELVREALVTKSKQIQKSQFDADWLSRYMGRGLLTANGEEHQRQRRLAQPAFHTQRINAYADTILKYTADTLADWRPGQVRDIAVEMEALTMYVVCKTLFDVDRESMADVAHRVGSAMQTLQVAVNKDFSIPFPIPDWVPMKMNFQRRSSRKIINETIEHILAQRWATADADGRVDDKGDLLSMLLLARDEDGDRLTDLETRDQLVTLFIAGHETTSNALTWTLYFLDQNPAVLNKLLAEIDRVLGGRTPTLDDLGELPYLEMVLEESMRLRPPVWMLSIRQINEEVMLGEYKLSPERRLLISPYVLQRRPQLFPDPLRFDPLRFSPQNKDGRSRYAHIPFGAGRRVCIGASFAMMEARLILAMLLQKFTFTLTADQEVVPYPRVTLAPKYGLKMELHGRS